MAQPDTATPPARRRAFFVYYKVEASQAGRLRQAFDRLAAAPAGGALPWRAELMRRSGPEDGPGNAADEGPDVAPDDAPAAGSRLQTWMEIYWLAEHAAGTAPDEWPGLAGGPALDGSSRDVGLAALRQLIEERARVAGIHALIRGTRHYEAFETCA